MWRISNNSFISEICWWARALPSYNCWMPYGTFPVDEQKKSEFAEIKRSTGGELS
jgi:hypothetical protein